MSPEGGILDLLVVGAGPTGIAIGAAARSHQLDVLLVDRGPLAANLHEFPTYMRFFTTRDRLEIADLPFTVPDDHPSLRQALVYYRSVVQHYAIPLALDEEVIAVEPGSAARFQVRSRGVEGSRTRQARAVAFATGYFQNPRHLGVPGEDAEWVTHRYRDPYRHFGERVAIVGGGNSAVEAALELWRNGVEVTVIHRGSEVRESVKYWLKPDFENRVAEGSITARFRTEVRCFVDRTLEVEGPDGRERLAFDRALVLVGYEPEVSLLRRAGIDVDPDSLVPTFDPETCETNVPGLYVAGSLHSGRDTNRIFIENSRQHAPRLVDHLRGTLREAERRSVVEATEPRGT